LEWSRHGKCLFTVQIPNKLEVMLHCLPVDVEVSSDLFSMTDLFLHCYHARKGVSWDVRFGNNLGYIDTKWNKYGWNFLRSDFNTCWLTGRIRNFHWVKRNKKLTWTSARFVPFGLYLVQFDFFGELKPKWLIVTTFYCN